MLLEKVLTLLRRKPSLAGDDILVRLFSFMTLKRWQHMTHTMFMPLTRTSRLIHPWDMSGNSTAAPSNQFGHVVLRLVLVVDGIFSHAFLTTKATVSYTHLTLPTTPYV